MEDSLQSELLIEQIRSVIKEEIKSMMEERLIAPAEAIKLFKPKISKQSLTKWTDAGLIPVRRVGGRIFYRISDILNAGAKIKKYQR
ncbi:MAG TPA: hypothetical protein VGZ71_11225 [Puia sp.]|jgi:hypothetical protein|nr:hypothetical protein [Puia sp.]